MSPVCPDSEESHIFILHHKFTADLCLVDVAARVEQEVSPERGDQIGRRAGAGERSVAGIGGGVGETQVAVRADIYRSEGPAMKREVEPERKWPAGGVVEVCPPGDLGVLDPQSSIHW